MARHTPTDGVLIVDDDLLSREVLAVLLQSEGFEVHTASSGEAALTQLRSLAPQPTAILTDIQMPGLAGPQFARELRHVCPPSTVLVCMSATGPARSVTDAFDAFLLKPFQPADFSQALQACRARATASSMKSPAEQSSPRGSACVPGPVSNASMSTPSDLGELSESPSIPLSSASESTPELDERIFSQLQEGMTGSQLRQLFALCLDDVRKRVTSMRSLAANGDAGQFTRQAHAIKGGCGMLGASELYTLAATLETHGLAASGLRAGSGANHLDKLAAACDRLEQILAART